jgi:hypothetical protein
MTLKKSHRYKLIYISKLNYDKKAFIEKNSFCKYIIFINECFFNPTVVSGSLTAPETILLCKFSN